jgi:hypothetical protein
MEKERIANEDAGTLAVILMSAARFCSDVENRRMDSAPVREEEDLRSKLGLCRAQIDYLEKLFCDDRLKIEEPLVREGFRHLITALMWVAFYTRSFIDFRLFRTVIVIESSFAYLLAQWIQNVQKTNVSSVSVTSSAANAEAGRSSGELVGSKKRRKIIVRNATILWAALCILVLNLILLIARPFWKQYRLERIQKQPAEIQKQTSHR